MKKTNQSSRETKIPRIGVEQPTFSNVDVVVFAAYKLRAHFRYVSVEDIAILANQIAPGRFAWAKYKDQIDLDKVRITLFDARKIEKGSYVLGNRTKGWLLTETGVARAEELAPIIGEVDLSKVVQTDEEKKKEEWIAKERGRILSSSIFHKFSVDGLTAISTREAESIFKIDEYITGKSRERKVSRLVALLGQDKEIGSMLTALSDVIMEK